MNYIRVVNFEKYQHYKHRRPPWIKLHTKLLESYEFARLQDASKAHLMMLWLLASRTDNRIPYDAEWIARKIGATEPVDLEVLIAQGFIYVEQDASTTLASCSPQTSRLSATETETETETEIPDSHESGPSPTPELAPPRKAPAAKRRPPKSAEPSASWVARLASVWAKSVGPVSHGRVGKALKPLVDKHGVEAVEGALEHYVMVMKSENRNVNVQWFANEGEIWIERARQPLVVDGWMSDELERLTRPPAARRPA